MNGELEIQWKQSDMVEVTLNEPDDFLKVRETLTRIGVASRKEKKIYQSCHILHKQGKYYIVHFKELFALDGKNTNFSLNDVQRRNRIVQLLVDWGLVSINTISQEKISDLAPLNQIKVLSFKEKNEWTLESKYNIGRKKQEPWSITYTMTEKDIKEHLNQLRNWEIFCVIENTIQIVTLIYLAPLIILNLLNGILK